MIKNLKSLISPTLRYFLETLDQVVVPSGRGKKIWVLSRHFYHHKLIDLPVDVSQDQKQAFLQIQLQSLSPYLNVNYVLHWQDNQVSLWFWDQARVQEAIIAQGEKISQVTVLPESVLKNPFLNGLRLVALMDGFEGQFWENGQLKSSRFWKELPSLQQWNYFCRAAGFQVADVLPEVQEFSFLNAPWIKTRSKINWLSFDTWTSPEAFIVFALLLILPFGYELGQLGKLYIDTESLENQIIELEQSTKKLEGAKAIAFSNLKNIQKLMLLESQPSPLKILQEIALKIPDKDVHLIDFNLKNERLVLTLAMNKNPDPTAYVQAFESSAYFEGVNADPGVRKNNLRVTLKLKRQKLG
jgi:hypothetical protein